MLNKPTRCGITKVASERTGLQIRASDQHRTANNKQSGTDRTVTIWKDKTVSLQKGFFFYKLENVKDGIDSSETRLS
jgi:hypothetical protein